MGDRIRRGSSMHDLSRSGSSAPQLAPGITKHQQQQHREQQQHRQPLDQQQQFPRPQQQPPQFFHIPSLMTPNSLHLAPGITKHPQGDTAQRMQEILRQYSAAPAHSSLLPTPAPSTWTQLPGSRSDQWAHPSQFSPGIMKQPAMAALMETSGGQGQQQQQRGRGFGYRGGANARRGWRGGRPPYRPATGGRGASINGRPVVDYYEGASDTSSNRGSGSGIRRSWNRGSRNRGGRPRGPRRGPRSSAATSIGNLPGEGSSSDDTARWVDSYDEKHNSPRVRHSSGGSAGSQSNYSEASGIAQNDEDPFSDSIPVPDDIVIDSAAVELANLPPDVNLDCLRYYLEVGTGYTAQVESMIFRSNRRSAVIRFSQDIEVENLQVFCTEVPLDDDQVFVDAHEIEEASAIQMTGLPTTWSEEIVRLVIENHILKFSIPTGIAKVVVADDVAVIALTSSSGYKPLMEAIKSQSQHYRSVAPFYRCLGLTMDADLVDYTTKLPTATAAAAASHQLALVISGFSKPLSSEKYVRLFFSSSRNGGADCIDELVVGNKMVVVRYSSEEVTTRLIEKIAQAELKFESDVLWVAVRSVDAHPLMDGRVFILSNLPGGISRVTLLYFLWAKARSRVVSIGFSRSRSMAIVEFEGEPGVDFDGLRSALAGGALVGRAATQRSAAQPAVELLQVPPITCVQMSGVPAGVSEQYVELHVDDTCSCHSAVVAVLEDGACALRLPDREAAVAVRCTDFVFEGVQLQVTPFHSLTGLTTGDELAVPWLMPPPLVLDFVDPAVLRFVASSPTIRHRLEEKLVAVQAQLVELPADASGAAGDGGEPATWRVEYSAGDMAVVATAAGGCSSVESLHSRWHTTVMRVVSTFCGDFCTVPVEVDARVWPMVKQAVAAGDGGEVGLGSEEDTDEGVHRVVLVGARSAVKAAAERTVKRADELCRRDGGSAVGSGGASSSSNGGSGGGSSSVQTEVRRCQLLYLQYRQLGKRLKAEDVVVTMQPSGRVSLTGPAAVLQPALEHIRGMLSRLHYRDVELTASGAELVVKKEGYQHLVASLRTAGLAAFWELTADRLVAMCAETADDLGKAVDVVRGQIRTFDVKAGADERRKAILGDAEFASKVAAIQGRWQKQAVVVLLSADGLSAAAMLPNAEAVVEVGQLWESALGQRRPVITVSDFLAFSLLRFHLRALLGPGGAFVSFEEKDGGSSGEILVSAPAALSTEICSNVRSFLDRVQYGWLLVRDPAFVQWLTSPAGRDFLSKSSSKTRTYARYTKTERLADRCRPDGRRLVVVRGCTLLQSAQCLMIGSSARLELAASGTGRQLLYFDGQGIQNQCSDIAKNRKASELQEGNCFCTHASKWPFNGILHVICPLYDPDPLAAKDDLFTFAILKGLEVVSNKKYSSVVLPSIGSDGFGFPPAVAAELLVKAMVMHFDKAPDSSIREVILADMDKDAAGCLCSAVKRVTSQAPPKSAPTQVANITANGLLVDIVRGDIERQQVDAVVNCLLGHGDLNGSGSVSLRLSRAAGPELQQACRRLAPGGQLDPGRVLVTKGYSLPCQNVINVCCGNRRDTTSPMVLSSHIALCLRKAEELHASSIAMPALGIDTLNVTAGAIAQATLEALAAHRPQSLKAVTCVLDDDDSYAAFCEKRKAIFSSCRNSTDQGANPNTATSSLCLAVLGLSKEEIADAIEKVAADITVREAASRRSSKP